MNRIPTQLFLQEKEKNLSEDSFLLKETHLDPKDWGKKKTNHRRQLDCTDQMIESNQS